MYKKGRCAHASDNEYIKLLLFKFVIENFKSNKHEMKSFPSIVILMIAQLHFGYVANISNKWLLSLKATKVFFNLESS